MAAADTLVIVAPQYTGDARNTGAIALATSMVLTDYLGDQYQTAVAYLAAHILTVADRGTAAGTSGTGGAGPVSSVTTGA